MIRLQVAAVRLVLGQGARTCRFDRFLPTMVAMKQRQVDAWMFLAVAVSRGDDGYASLEDFIPAADWVNHALPLDEEVTGGLNRLMAAGFVRNRGNTFALSEAGEALYLRVQKRAGIWKQFEQLEAAFDNLTPPLDPIWTPETGAIEAAIVAWETKAAPWVKGESSPKAD